MSMSHSIIDHTSGQSPLYRRVRDDLVRRVTSGEWRPGELVPSEVALAQEYSVSVGTARKALDELVQDKLVVRQRGRGTTIATNRQRYEPFRFYRLRSQDDANAAETTGYLSCLTTRGSAAEAAKFGLKRGSALAKIHRVRSRAGRALIRENILLRDDLCPNIFEVIEQLKPDSIYSVIERTFHILITKVDEKVRAVAADNIDAEILGVSEGEPIIEVERLAFDLSGNVIEYRTMRAANGVYYFSSLT